VWRDPGEENVHSEVSVRDASAGRFVPGVRVFASVIESDAPVVVQHIRLDSRQAENALPSHTQATISGPFVADEDGYLGRPELAPAACKKSIDGFR
jgi:hypothetical protein